MSAQASLGPVDRHHLSSAVFRNALGPSVTGFLLAGQLPTTESVAVEVPQGEHEHLAEVVWPAMGRALDEEDALPEVVPDEELRTWRWTGYRRTRPELIEPRLIEAALSDPAMEYRPGARANLPSPGR